MLDLDRHVAACNLPIPACGQRVLELTSVLAFCLFIHSNGEPGRKDGGDGFNSEKSINH